MSWDIGYEEELGTHANFLLWPVQVSCQDCVRLVKKREGESEVEGEEKRKEKLKGMRRIKKGMRKRKEMMRLHWVECGRAWH